MQEGDIITIEATELVAGGDAIARVDGFPVFASNVFPGDVARVRLYEVKKGFAKAEMVEIVRPSAQRRVAPCPVADECGGCDWTALRLDHQLEAKRRILTESLRRIGKFDVAALPEITTHPSPLNYRLRSRLHHDGDAVGFYAMRSNRVVPLSSECEVVGVETARAFGNAARATTPHPPSAPSPLTRGEGYSMVDLARASSGNQNSSRSVELGSPLPAHLAGAPGQVAFSPSQPHRDGEKVPKADEGYSREDAPSDIWELDNALITGDRDLTLTVDAYTYHLHTRAFFQVNRHLLATLLRLVAAHVARTVNRQHAVDLYAGVGFFTLPMAKLFDRVTMIEGSPLSARYARMNVPWNVKVVEAAVEHHIVRLGKSNFTFLDPPRAGARQDVIAAVAQKTQERITYLSCDPVTFARDSNRIVAAGWRLASLDLLDLFPNTHHVETLASFER
jgi:23S rRNA (uracil1939-C5)-methyltransferase